MKNYLLSTYAPLNVHFTRGEGCWLWDEDGNRYLDAISGLGVNILGHGHPPFIQALHAQLDKLIHTSNLYINPAQNALAQKLSEMTGMEKAFFGVSGCEAIECALKLARLYGHQKEIRNPSIVVFDKAYHGRTLATLTASSERFLQAGFEPLTPGFVRAPFNDLSALEKITETRQDIVAVLIEPIQGQGGIRSADVAYLKALRSLCDQKGWLLILDEIQTGLGRTGKFLCSQHADIKPDIVALAKGLGNGICVGACLTRGLANTFFTPGKHGSTFGGNPLAMHAGLSVLSLLSSLNLIENVKTQGTFLFQTLKEQFQSNPQVQEVRGQGLMIGIELSEPIPNLTKQALELGILINVTQQKVIRLLPPLIFQSKEAEILSEKLYSLLH